MFFKTILVASIPVAITAAVIYMSYRANPEFTDRILQRAKTICQK